VRTFPFTDLPKKISGSLYNNLSRFVQMSMHGTNRNLAGAGGNYGPAKGRNFMKFMPHDPEQDPIIIGPRPPFLSL
jgi:hypothetical protein